MTPYIAVILFTYGSSIGTQEAPAQSLGHCWTLIAQAVYQSRLDALFDPNSGIRFAMCKPRKGTEI